MASEATRSELIQAFVVHSPFARELGIEIAEITGDRAELTMPFREGIATFGDTIHGGAIATLIDTAGMVAAWADDVVPEKPGGATVALSIDYVAAARGKDLRAVATAVKRGRRLCFCEIALSTADGELVAKGLMTYSFA
jgi:uncharacterized protein (TIGR00369 family)